MITDTQVERWLAEDLGHRDVTNEVPGTTTARLVAREDGIAAGTDAARAVFEVLDCDVEPRVEAGDSLSGGDVLLSVRGPTRDVLRGERTAVNLAGHASGIATKTAAAVDAARTVSDDVAVAGTRKTTPGLREVEKRAVAAGGGDTHRLDASHMVMVKDNHVAAMGLEAAVERLGDRASFTTKVEVEVEDPDDAPRAAAAGADVVMLDNCTPEEVERAVDLLAEEHPDVLVEASGGITIETVPDYAGTGVDVISMGSLTHSAPSLNCSFTTDGG